MWHKGVSLAKHLFKVVVIVLKVECQKREVFLHLFHISGDRMIACGINGGLRGNKDVGVYSGLDIHTYFHLDWGKFGLEGPRLENWCRS